MLFFEISLCLSVSLSLSLALSLALSLSLSFSYHSKDFFRLQIVSPSFGVHLLFEECLSTVGCFRRYICFVCPKLSSAFVLSPYENQFLVVGDVGGLYVIVYGWCWSITLSFPLFSHMFHYSSECITLVWCPFCCFRKVREVSLAHWCLQLERSAQMRLSVF